MYMQGFFCGAKKRSLFGSAVSNEGRAEAVSEVLKKTSTSLGKSCNEEENDVTLARKRESEKKNIYIYRKISNEFFFNLH